MSDDLKAGDVELAAELTAAWLSNANTRVQAEDVPTFMRLMHATISELRRESSPEVAGSASAADTFEPAVTVRKSLASQDHIISLIDGKPYKTLRRHLSVHGLDEHQYRQRYGLKADYPMVAPAYAEVRRALAKKAGLGRKPGEKAPAKRK